MAPKRLRRQGPGSGQDSIWDVEKLLVHLHDLGAKQMHAALVLRATAARIAAVARAAGCWGPAGCILDQTAKLSDSTPMRTWAGLAFGGSDLEALGLPRRAAGLLDALAPLSTELIEAHTSADGTTTKLVIGLHDGRHVESVIMRMDQRTTICLSSQVGCAMGCAFCATGTLPVVGDLYADEIVEQLLHANAVEAAAGRASVSNAVFMGMGEPLNNYGAVVTAIKTMTQTKYLGHEYSLQQNKIVVSTVGVIPKMHRLAEDIPTVCLALSLHAPTQELRERIVPAAQNYPLPELMEALDDHIARCKRSGPGRRVAMVEYVLLSGVNDSEVEAVALGRLLAPRARDVMVNLIPYNPGATSAPNGFQPPTDKVVERFRQIVAAFPVATQVRREMGRDISGACGQLALKRPLPVSSANSFQARDLEDFVPRQRNQGTIAKVAVGDDGFTVDARDAYFDKNTSIGTHTWRHDLMTFGRPHVLCVLARVVPTSISAVHRQIVASVATCVVLGAALVTLFGVAVGLKLPCRVWHRSDLASLCN